MFSPAEPRNSSYDVTKVSDINPSIMDRIRGWGDKFRDFLSEKCCSCVATVPSFALVLLALVLMTLLIASLPLAFAITYWRPQAVRSPELKSHAISRHHHNFNFTDKIAAPLPIPSFKDYFPANITSCRGFGFACASDPSRVIGTNLRCDGFKDCNDNSDEYDCSECRTSFSCKKSNRLVCLHGRDLCNGVSQCDDESDETKYCRDTCDSKEFQCSDKLKCIPDNWRCDGDEHCSDFSDEVDCDSCNGDAKMCKPEKKCLPIWKLCNGEMDCSDGSDEMDCDCKSCSADGNVLCDGVEKMCMSIENVCDGTPHCPHGEDEENCAGTCPMDKKNSTPGNGSMTEVNSTEVPEMVKCHSDDNRTFDWRYICDGTSHHDFLYDFLIGECDVPCRRCYSPLAFDCFLKNKSSSAMVNVRNDVSMHRCISRSRVCDGVRDCSNGADEADCDCSSSSALSCSNTENQSDQCFKPSQKCDGAYDCDTQTDEHDCKSCTDNAFHCAADRKCIPDRGVCDGIKDCSDGADEKNCSCEKCMRHPIKMYHCESGLRCFREEDVCDPYTKCPNATQRDKMFCAMRYRNAMALI